MSGLWLVLCKCVTEDGEPFRVSENCPDCAAERVTAHAALGHGPRIFPPAVEHSRDHQGTQRLLRKTGGW